MRIGIDAREIQDGVCTGIGRALYNFLCCFDTMTTDDFCVLFSVRPLFFSFSRRITNFVAGERPVFFWDQIVLPRLVTHERIDLFYSPYYKLPLFLSCRKVCAVLDVMYLVFPLYRVQLGIVGRLYHRVFARQCLRSADRILTCSGYSRSDIVRVHGVDQKKVTVIPLSVSPAFYEEKNSVRARQILLEYRISRRYILYVGNFKPHKNVAFLFGVLRDILVCHSDIHLVLVGSNDCEVDELMSNARCEGVEANVIVIKTLTDEGVLRALYSSAEVFVMPSLYEGFGIPPLEAMACGCPVVCSDRTALPESVGDAALLVDPFNRSDFSTAVGRFLNDRVLREKYIQRGLMKVKEFSVQGVAEKMMCFFREVMDTTR